MGKLLELLNEWYKERYKTDKEFDSYEDYGGNDYGFFKSSDSNHITMYECDVRTKKYGFIKRLVDNDKIDFQNNKLQVLKDLITNGNQIYDFKVYSDYESLLMLLAIQDNPVSFLVSILK